MAGRSVPLILVASESVALAESVAAELRRQGNIVYVAHSADGCLRVATSVGPDTILLDPAMQTKRLEQLLKAHPLSAQSEILHLAPNSARGTFPRMPIAAGPHAA
jgi:DNA-binding response OmpR family regulator